MKYALIAVVLIVAIIVVALNPSLSEPIVAVASLAALAMPLLVGGQTSSK